MTEPGIRVFFKNSTMGAYQPLFGAEGLPASAEFYGIREEAATTFTATALGSSKNHNKIAAFVIHREANEIVLDMGDVERDEKGLPEPSEIARVAKEQLGDLGVDKFDLILRVPFMFFRGETELSRDYRELHPVV